MPEFSKEIYSFVEIARERSIRRAADKLNISSSALSRQMRILEAELGVTLFTRQVTGVQLTENGRVLLRQVELWLEDHNRLRATLANAEGNHERVIRIGVMECFSGNILAELTSFAHRKGLADRVETRVAGTAALLRDLEEARLDLVVAFNVHHSLTTRVLFDRSCRVGLVYSPQLFSLAEDDVPIARALDFPICLPDEDLSLHTRLYAELLKQRRRAGIFATSNSTSFIREMTARGECVSFLTWFDVHREVTSGRLCHVPLAERRLSETLCVCVSGVRTVGPNVTSLAYESARLIDALGPADRPA
ncbi:LysR family transcriptional regulator [Paracoccus sp. MBLB3053]|uniref:LysR family transcriptional regulator n=1 Tax=Paracoccus aurantius TaxID=3073814 RepID=A0ABU2HY57_9RHOB|nr:LysR family transcriptional regulator [Paracoccus sp. MBLB3053]MDS9469524.1 LysR family transcriptional regulator [Paracoccus sp. MBLB3053]